jgi:DNA-binding NarL/FixJ family response regulator
MPLRVLIVDDSEPFRRSLAALLRKEKSITIVGEAAGGLETIRQCVSLHPDLVLLDISMPGMTGPETAYMIKAASPTTRVVFMSMHEDNNYHEMARLMSVDGYLHKRTLHEDLPKMLKRLQHARR